MKLKTDNRPQVTVIGGAHTDIVVRTQAPLGYEGATVSEFTEIRPGGRAACIAAALARLRCRVHFVSCIGTDPFAGVLMTALQKQNVNLDYVERSKDEPTGLVHHIVSKKGSVQRIYSHGASMKMSRDALYRASVMISSADIVVVTTDIPRDVFEYAAQLAHHYRAPVLVDPDPQDGALDEDLSACDLLVPDESAAAALCGWELKTMSDATRCAARLLNRGAGGVALFLGARGVVSGTSPRDPEYIPLPHGKQAANVNAKSAFDAGMAWAMALGYNLPEAVWIGVSCATAMKLEEKDPFDAFVTIDELVESQSLELVRV